MQLTNILAVRNDRFGEFLLNIPAFRALKYGFIGASLSLVVEPYVQELAGCIDFVDEVIIWENRRHRFNEILELSRELKRKKFDLCVIFNPSKEFNIISFLARIPLRIGYARKWDFFLTHKIVDKKYLADRHEVEYNLELVSLMGAKTEDRTITLTIDDQMSNNLLENFNIEESGNLIALHPWTSDPLKQWPVNNFMELARRLTKELGLEIIVIGGKDEENKGSELFSRLEKSIVNLTGKTTLKQLAGLLKKCKLLISCDSGPVHLACAVNTAVIAIFRNDILAKSAKRWGPWGEHSIVIEKNNLSDISVAEVFNGVREALNI